MVSPSVRDAILARALAAGRVQQVPNDAEALGDFVQGPLHDSLVHSLGPELGVSVTNELERIIAIAAPHAAAKEREPRPVEPVRKPSTKLNAVGASRRPSRSTMPSRDFLSPGSAVAKDAQWAEGELRAISPTVPAGRTRQGEIVGEGRGARRGGLGQPVSADFPAGTASALGVIGTASVEPSADGRPLVLVASTDAELLRVFNVWLAQRAHVEPVSGVRDLVVRVGGGGAPRVVVVLDGKNPSIRPLALAALAEELGDTFHVLLWGVAQHVHAKMRNVSAATEKWLVYGIEASPNDLAARCIKIVG
ncbi:MAG TPA: hypothetical protein VFZ53_34900 [Polyangiaceae bacterium]